jgi:hypothetical protein
MNVFTDFPGGGGSVTLIDREKNTIRFMPHNEGQGGWSQVWWYFAVDGCKPGEQMILQLDRGEPLIAGISPQVFFSYDQVSWGLTDVGQYEIADGKEYFVYRHMVRSNRVWFAYDLPYTPEHFNTILLPVAERSGSGHVFELCKTKNDRSVYTIEINENPELQKKTGIWLQARAHAFESGASWVLNELALWLLSDDLLANQLRKQARIFITPIVDVDGVVEGRTGKYQKPYDHWMGWDEEPSYWPETKAIKNHIKNLAEANMADLFIDFHGPGGLSHPYFIIPDADKLPYPEQRSNRKNFFKALDAKELDEEAKLYQSMTQIHYSERSWNYDIQDASHEWVTMNTNRHTLALTIEVNMNTPLSHFDGFHAEALVIGQAIANYFLNDMHKK